MNDFSVGIRARDMLCSTSLVVIKFSSIKLKTASMGNSCGAYLTIRYHSDLVLAFAADLPILRACEDGTCDSAVFSSVLGIPIICMTRTVTPDKSPFYSRITVPLFRWSVTAANLGTALILQA